MRTPNPRTEEFVRQHRLLIERTRDDPGQLATALEEAPELAISLTRLDQHLRTVGWLTAGAHPDFRKALRDYRERWAEACEAVAGRIWDLIYQRAAFLVTEEFLRRYRYLIARTANNPRTIADLGLRRPGFAYAFGVLDSVHGAISDPDALKYAPQRLVNKYGELRRLIGEGRPEFRLAVDDFDLRWREPFGKLVEEHKGLSHLIGQSSPFMDAGPLKYPNDLGLPGHGPLFRGAAIYLGNVFGDETPPSKEQIQRLKRWGRVLQYYGHGRGWLDALLNSLPDVFPAEYATRPFDARQDSAAEVITYAMQFVAEEGFGNFEFDIGEAFDWLYRNGIELNAIESRIKEFPEIVIPKDVCGGSGFLDSRIS